MQRTVLLWEFCASVRLSNEIIICHYLYILSCAAIWHNLKNGLVVLMRYMLLDV